MAVSDHVHDGLAVDGVAQGLTHLLIVKGGHGVVQIHRLYQIHGTLQNLEVAVQLRRLRRGQMGAQVDGLALQGRHQRIGALVNFIGHLIQIGGGPPVIVKALDDEVLLRGAGHVHKRAGTHGMGSLIVVALGDDGAGEIADELQIPLGNGDGHGPFVNGLDLLDNRKRRHQRRTLRCIGAAFDGIYHILRRHRCAIMELHTLTQGKGISPSVLRQLVALRNSGDQFTLGIGLYQALKQVEQDLSGSCGHHPVRVKTVIQVLGDANGDLSAADCFAAVISLSALVFAAVSASGEYGADQSQRQEKSQ